ncbi:MAG: CBS domain-containing protein [Mycobacteriaceae bacterium]
MRISDVLQGKGFAVLTVEPDTDTTTLLGLLAENNVGAAVVLDGDRIAGIVSERDIVRQLHTRGPTMLQLPVSDIMTREVRTCSPDDSSDGVSVTMTEQRARHLPVVVDGRLVGLVSIGDVVKSHIAELEHDREQLTAYISQG